MSYVAVTNAVPSWIGILRTLLRLRPVCECQAVVSRVPIAASVSSVTLVSPVPGVPEILSFLQFPP